MQKRIKQSVPAPVPAEKESHEQLTRAEAEAMTAAVRRDAEVLWQKLLALYEGGAHLALGYDSWGAYFAAEFGQGKAHAYRLLRAGRVHRIVSLHVETRGMTEAQARVLDHLDEERLRDVARHVRRLGGWNHVSTRELKRIAYGPIADAGSTASTYPILKRLQDAERAIMDLRRNPDDVRDALRKSADPEARLRAQKTIRLFREELDFLENVIVGTDVALTLAEPDR